MKRVEVYRYGPPEVLQYREADAPQPTARQIAIRVEAASVNFADIQSRRGIHHTLPKPPYVPGIDCVGVVEACGHEVTKFQPGQRVMAFCSSGTIRKSQLQMNSSPSPYRISSIRHGSQRCYAIYSLWPIKVGSKNGRRRTTCHSCCSRRSRHCGHQTGETVRSRDDYRCCRK